MARRIEDLTYCLNYTPSRDVVDDIKYTCHDKRIHIRFRDFVKEQIIEGFERKLTYLLTYLIHGTTINMPKMNKETCEQTLARFTATQDFQRVLACIQNQSVQKVKGVSLSLNYSKKRGAKPLGAVAENLLPICYESTGEMLPRTLDNFLKVLNIRLEDYLFNDRYAIQICRKRTNEINKKFTNKQAKTTEVNTYIDDFVKLW